GPARLGGAHAAWQGVLARLTPPAWQGLAQQDATVPAGIFPGCYQGETQPGWGPFASRTLTWSHPAVPVSGVVKGQAIDQRNSFELVAFGEHGAVSEIQ